MTVYTNSTPGAAEVLANSQPLMLANFQYLQTSGGVDHNFTNNTATSQDGFHKVVHFVNQGGDPALVASTGEVYTKTANGDQQLFFQSGGGVVTQLTGPNSAVINTNGHVWLPGPILVNWGQITSTAAAFTTLNFTDSANNINFPNNCLAIFTQPFGSGTPPGSQATIEIRKSTIGSTSFQWCFVTSSVQYTGFFWVAIGN